MSLMPTLLMGICRVSAWPCTSSTGCTVGFLTGTATFILSPGPIAGATRRIYGVFPCASRNFNGVDATPSDKLAARAKDKIYKRSDHSWGRNREFQGF